MKIKKNAKDFCILIILDIWKILINNPTKRGKTDQRRSKTKGNNQRDRRLSRLTRGDRYKTKRTQQEDRRRPKRKDRTDQKYYKET